MNFRRFNWMFLSKYVALPNLLELLEASQVLLTLVWASTWMAVWKLFVKRSEVSWKKNEVSGFFGWFVCPYHPCMEYVPTWHGWFLWVFMEVNIPYTHGMGLGHVFPRCFLLWLGSRRNPFFFLILIFRAVWMSDFSGVCNPGNSHRAPKRRWIIGPQAFCFQGQPPGC